MEKRVDHKNQQRTVPNCFLNAFSSLRPATFAATILGANLTTHLLTRTHSHTHTHLLSHLLHLSLFESCRQFCQPHHTIIIFSKRIWRQKFTCSSFKVCFCQREKTMNAENRVKSAISFIQNVLKYFMRI